MSSPHPAFPAAGNASAIVFKSLLKKSQSASCAKRQCCPAPPFYNYFDDKYDLLQYCLMTARDQLDSGYRDMDNCSERMNCLMENCFDYLDQNIDTVQKILRNNPANQYLINQVRLYLLSNMSAAFQSNPNSHQFKVPGKWRQNYTARRS